METVKAKLFVRPDGRHKEVEIRNVYPACARYINENGIKISLEDIGGGTFAIYLDDGKKLNDEPAEVIILSKQNEKCEDCIKRGVEMLNNRERDWDGKETGNS